MPATLQAVVYSFLVTIVIISHILQLQLSVDSSDKKFDNSHEMSFPSLTARLAALQETTRSVQTLITRLANLEFAPGSVPLDLGEDEDDVAAELSAEIHQTLKEQEEDLELLEQEVEDLPVGRTRNEKGREREVLIEGVKRAKGEIKE